jgi:hypothetical protein
MSLFDKLRSEGSETMIYRDPKCVYVANNLGVAETTVVFLGQNGIPAQVMNPMTLGGLVGLTWLSPTGVSSYGIEVWVDNPAQADRAKELLQAQADFKSSKVEQADRSGDITALCDDCGKPSTFPGSQRGSVQNCPQCGAYMDVVDAQGDSEPETDERIQE